MLCRGTASGLPRSFLFYVVINLFGRRTARFSCDRAADEIEIVVYAADSGDEKNDAVFFRKNAKHEKPLGSAQPWAFGGIKMLPSVF